MGSTTVRTFRRKLIRLLILEDGIDTVERLATCPTCRGDIYLHKGPQEAFLACADCGLILDLPRGPVPLEEAARLAIQQWQSSRAPR